MRRMKWRPCGMSLKRKTRKLKISERPSPRPREATHRARLMTRWSAPSSSSTLSTSPTRNRPYARWKTQFSGTKEKSTTCKSTLRRSRNTSVGCKQPPVSRLDRSRPSIPAPRAATTRGARRLGWPTVQIPSRRHSPGRSLTRNSRLKLCTSAKSA